MDDVGITGPGNSGQHDAGSGMAQGPAGEKPHEPYDPDAGKKERKKTFIERVLYAVIIGAVALLAAILVGASAVVLAVIALVFIAGILVLFGMGKGFSADMSEHEAEHYRQQEEDYGGYDEHHEDHEDGYDTREHEGE
ncbi:MAG: hypothetical protein ABIH11_06100 [Candidatus Altiarchaeota archaeon]